MTTDTPMDPSAEDSMADDWAQALEEQSHKDAASNGAPAFDAASDAFAPLNKGGNTNDINMVLDIPVQLSVELDGPKYRSSTSCAGSRLGGGTRCLGR